MTYRAAPLPITDRKALQDHLMTSRFKYFDA
jgi:hypothetical protein